MNLLFKTRSCQIWESITRYDHVHCCAVLRTKHRNIRRTIFGIYKIKIAERQWVTVAKGAVRTLKEKLDGNISRIYITTAISNHGSHVATIS